MLTSSVPMHTRAIVAADIYDLNERQLLVLVDNFSNFIEASHLPSLMLSFVTYALYELFA